MSNETNKNASAILRAQALGFPWVTQDPFLFCAYHDDAYPAGNAEKGPAVSLQGRDIGQDFSRKDGWSMYHGEMFPLLRTDADNPLELFQIWLNLPARSKMTDPYFTMLWRDQIPGAEFVDAQGRSTRARVIAGRLPAADSDLEPLPPPPNSWAADDQSDVAIWTIKMAPGACWTLPAAIGAGTRRSLYFFKGESVVLGGQSLAQHAMLELDAQQSLEMVSGPVQSEFLLLQGKPIAEPVAQHGPFVMNTNQEIRQAIADYQRTGFGGWPWPDSAPIHGDEPTRFARHPDGRREELGV